MTESLLSFRDINKRFGKKPVLSGLNLELDKGEVFALLGPNGAGKSTFFRCLTGILRLDSGEILYNKEGLRDRTVRERFAFLPESFSPPSNLKAKEFLYLIRRGLNRGRDQVKIVLDKVGLSKAANQYIGTYSRGMVQRLGLALIMLKDPEVIILDEPMLGLDSLGQKCIHDLAMELNRRGKTVIFSSHVMPHVEKLCTRLGVINGGRIVFEGGLKSFLNKHGESSLEQAFLKEIGYG